MATEAGILESISEKKVQDQTGDLRCVQIHNPPEYTNKPLEVLKEHSNESEIKGGSTDSAALQSTQMIGQYPPNEAATATSESSTLSESCKDQSSHSVTVGIIDSSEGEVFVEAPPRVQIHLEDIYNGSNAGIHRENPINKEKEKLESGNMLQKDHKDELEEEKDVTVPKNSSSEANFTDASLHNAAVTNVPLEEKMQRNDFGNDYPVKKSDKHIFESTGANQNTEKADDLVEEKTSTGIHDNSVVNQYQDLENLGDEVDENQLEKSINLEHEKQDFEEIKDKEESETQELTENLSVNPERLPFPENLGETGLQKEDEENDRFDDIPGPPSKEQCDIDDRRESMENYHENEEIIRIVSSNETSQSQNVASVEDKEEKLEESSFLASEEKILESLDTTEKVCEIQYGKTSADASVKELSNLKLSAEESALEDEMSSDEVKKVSFKEQEPIQSARVIIIEMEACKEETHTEMDPRKCTSQMKKEPEESNLIEGSLADKDVECISLVSTEKIPETMYASKNRENEDLDQRKQDSQMDASISTKTEVPGIPNDQAIIMTHKETHNVLYEDNSLQANDAMEAGDDLKKGENLNEQAKATSEDEKFKKACRVVEEPDKRETVATAISMDKPRVVSAEDIIQDQETTHSRNEKENEVQEEEETNYGNIDASASSQLTDEIESLNEEKKAQKFEEISEVVQEKDHCHEKVLNQDDLKAQTTVYDMPVVSKTQNEEGIQEREDTDGIDIDKIERDFEEKHVEAMAETKPSNHVKDSEKGHAQEAVPVDIKEHDDETISDGTLGPERINDETDGAKLENNFIVVSNEVEVTEGLTNTEKENIDRELPMNIEEIPKDDEVMCEKIEKAAAELIHEYQTIMTNDLSETGIPGEKKDNSGENVGDLPVAHKLEEEIIQVCENMDRIKQEMEPENVGKASKSTSRHHSQMTIADTEATDLDSSGDGVSMDKALGASSTIQAFILGNSQKATDPEEAEEKICAKINEKIGHDKHLGVSLKEEAQKDIHKKNEDNKRMEDIILGDEQIDETKSGLCSNEEQMKSKKLDKRDELKQGKETYKAVVNREICLEENPILDTPENVQEDDKWGNKLEKPSDEISVKIIMAQDSASNKEYVEEKGSPEEKEESSQEKGEAGVTFEQRVDRLDTKDPSHKPHGKDEKTIMTNDLSETGIPIEKSDNSGENVGDLSVAHKLEEENIQVCENMDCIKQELEPENVEKASKSASRHHSQMTIADTEATDLDSSGDGVSMDKTLSASSTIQAFILGNSQEATDPEEAEEKICEKINEKIGKDKHLGVSLEEETQKDIHKINEDNKRMEDIILGDGQIDETKAGPCSNEEQMEGKKCDKGDELKEGKETYEAVVDREICLEENPILDTPENVQEDDKWGNELEKPPDEISLKIIMAQYSASNKEDVEEKGSPEEKKESSQEKGEVGVTLEQPVDRLDTKDLSHKLHGKDEKTSSVIGQNGDPEPARVKDEAQNGSGFDISDTHELVGQYVDDLEGIKHGEVSNSTYEDQLDEHTDTKGNTVVDDFEKASQKLEMISISEDKNQEITCETEAVNIENLNTDYNLNNMISDMINTNGDNETAKSTDEEFLEKNIKDTPDSHSLATQKLHDAAREKYESETIIESGEQIHQTTSNKDNIDTDICKEKTGSNRLDFISESVPDDQSGESDAPKVDNLADDEKLKIPAMGDLNDDHETAKVKCESILEKSMDTISDSCASVLEKTYGFVDEKHKAPNSMSKEQIHQAINTEENKQVAVYNENIGIRRLDIIVKSGPEDQSPEKMTSQIEKTLDEDMINDAVNPLFNSQASIKDTLQEEENLTVYARSTGVHKSTDHSITEEDISSDSKSSGSSIDQSAEKPIMKEETSNGAILGSSLKYNVIENACELESEEKKDDVPEEKETSDTVLQESPSTVSDALERSDDNLSGKQTIWEKEVSENKASLSTECDFVEEGFQEDKKETKIADLAPDSAYSKKSNETNEVNNSMKNGITNKEVETLDDDQSHEANCSGKQSEDNENASIKDEESTNNRINDTPTTSALGSEAASGSLHRGQTESITREEETIRNMKLDQEAASDLTSVEQNLDMIIKTDLANSDILEEDKCNLVAQCMESEVVSSKDEECISKADGNLPTMPIPAKEVRWEIEEKHEKDPNYEEQFHERRITNNNMDDDTLEEDKNIEEIERAPVRVFEEQSHKGTTRTGILENEIVEDVLSASQNIDEEKTSKIAFISEGNEHSCEAGEVSKRPICTLLKEAKSTVEAASRTSMQSEVGANELNEAHTSVFNQKFESLDPEKNQEEETPTRERNSDSCIGVPYNLVSVEPALAARDENTVDLTIDKEVKDSVWASHENSETTAETKSTEIEPEDDALTIKKNSVDKNMQKHAYWVGSEDHIHDATEDCETTECVALENRNKEEMEDRQTLQSKKMEDGKQEERKEIQADMEISEAIYPGECNNESSEEKGTLNKGSEKETLELVQLEKPLNAFNIMEEREFADRFVPNKDEPEVERSLQAKEMKDEKQEEENKIQSKEKITEADNTNKCNKESSEEKRITERGAEKQKPDAVELQNLLNVVPEGLEVAYQTENINSDGQEKEVTDGNLEAGFHKKEDKALEDIVIELDVVDHSNEPNHDSDATEGVLEQEKILKVVNFSATKDDQIKMVGDSSIKSYLVEEIKDVEPSGSHLQKESVEPKALETEEKFESISFEEEPEKNEKLGVGLQNDANEVMQLEEASNKVFDKLPTAGLSEKTDTITSEDVEAPDVAHVRDKPFHKQLQGDENKTEIKKPETKWEPEEIDTMVNEILNDKVKEPGCMPSKKNHVKMELSEKIDTILPVDEEQPTTNVEFSSITTASSSEIMQDVSENLDKESVPKESTQDVEFANNMMDDEEGPIKIEKFEHISTNSVFVDRTCNKNSMTSDANEKGEETIDQEDREKLEEASNLMSNEKVNEWDDSLAAFIEDKDNSQNTPIKQATEVTTSAGEKEITLQTEGRTHEKVRDFGNSENKENQQTDQDDLPVSRFLMDRILQEEGEKLAGACDVKCKDKLQVEIHDQQNDVNISKQESNSVSLSVEQVKDGAIISEGKVEDLIEIEGSSDLVQQSNDLKKDTEYAILKDDESPDRNLHDTSLAFTAGEDVKDELSHLLDTELTNNISDNNMELVQAEEHSPESKVDVDELKKLDNIIPIPAPEMMTESIIQKDDESLKKNSDVATVIKAFEEDTLKKEGGKESPEISQDIAENNKASYTTSEEQIPSVAEPVRNAKGEIQVKKTVSNIDGDQPGKSFPSSSIEDSTLGEALESQSGGIKVETRKENQDGTSESQMKDVKNNLSKELIVTDSHKVQQSEPIVEPTNETVQAGERFLAERSTTVSADEKQAKGIADAHMKEEKIDEEKDGNKTAKSGNDAAVVVEAKDADVKPAHKKSHNILSGVGSKVKHSIAKVKKAITGKSSHSKTLS